MDRFIPCRMGENLQSKFEAVSQKQEEELRLQESHLANELGLNNDETDNDLTMNANNPIGS